MTKKNPQHRELEVKLAADDVCISDFNRWCWARGPAKYEHVIGPDTYYVQGQNVLRHRQNSRAGELTVKRRTSAKSTKDRVEIDLRFDGTTTANDVKRFLAATGWEPAFNVVKDCHIFWFDGKPGFEAVIYDVRCVFPDGQETKPRRFVEFEIHKADSFDPRALFVLKDLEKEARLSMNMGPTETESLYEIYSGKRYRLVKS